MQLKPSFMNANEVVLQLNIKLQSLIVIKNSLFIKNMQLSTVSGKPISASIAMPVLMLNQTFKDILKIIMGFEFVEDIRLLQPRGS